MVGAFKSVFWYTTMGFTLTVHSWVMAEEKISNTPPETITIKPQDASLPTVTQEAITQSLLNLLKNVHAPEDLTQENIKKWIGYPLERSSKKYSLQYLSPHAPDERYYSFFSSDLFDDWKFTIALYAPNNLYETELTYGFSLENPKAQSWSSCMVYELLHDALLGIGFQTSPIFGPEIQRIYQRNQIQINTVANKKNPANNNQHCLDYILIRPL